MKHLFVVGTFRPNKGTIAGAIRRLHPACKHTWAEMRIPSLQGYSGFYTSPNTRYAVEQRTHLRSRRG